MWTNVGSTELNEHDIFAFVNMQSDTVLKGRLVTLSDLSRGLIQMDSTGACVDVINLPEWCTVQPEEIITRMLFESLGKLPGSDMKNKVHNLQNGNYTDEQLGEVMQDVVKVALVKPTCVILKYIPDLSLSKEDMKNFCYGE
jgi:hypothetical protein